MLGTKNACIISSEKKAEIYLILNLGRLKHHNLDHKDIVKSFHKYMEFGGHSVTSKLYLENLEKKLNSAVFCNDINNFKRSDINYDIHKAFENIKELIEMI